MNSKLSKKLAKLPTSPGVYFHKNSESEIIYIGKAANLRNRVRQYFQPSRIREPKTDLLVSEITDVDWTEVETEVDALFLEAELVRRYLPRYNILLRDDKSLSYVRIDIKSDYPTVKLIRRPLDDRAEYFGPFINGLALKKALRYLRRAFPYATSKSIGQKRASLHYHLGLDPGLEDGRTSLKDYRSNLKKLMQYLRGNRLSLTKDIEKDMIRASKSKDFEQAAKLRNQLFSLQSLSRQVLFGDHEIQDASRDQSLVELASILGLPKPPERIEGFDISHIQGTDNVASMVVFGNGVPNKAAYRKFKMYTSGNDDFAHMSEAITRRFRPANTKKWGLADLIIIDGGKGQLAAALKAQATSAHARSIPMIGLAKRYEEIIVQKPTTQQNLDLQGLSLQATVINIDQDFIKKMGGFVEDKGDFLTITLPQNSSPLKLLQRIRDESHRFAVSYHSTLRTKRQTTSLLEDLPGFGPATRKKLIKHFGSLAALASSSENDITKIIGSKKAKSLCSYLGSIQKP